MTINVKELLLKKENGMTRAKALEVMHKEIGFQYDNEEHVELLAFIYSLKDKDATEIRYEFKNMTLEIKTEDPAGLMTGYSVRVCE